MKHFLLIPMVFLIGCETKTLEPQAGDDFKSHMERVNNLIVNGDRCLYEESAVCDVPFQALFTTDLYINKHIEVRGIFVIKKLHYRPDSKPSYHAFLFQSPEQYRLCDPNTSIELIFNDSEALFNNYSSLNRSYLYVKGVLLPRMHTPWRRLDVKRGIGMNNLLIDSKFIAIPDNPECMEQFSPLPSL